MTERIEDPEVISVRCNGTADVPHDAPRRAGVEPAFPERKGVTRVMRMHLSAPRVAGLGSDLGKYVLLQLPNWVFAAGLLAILSAAFELPAWIWLGLPVLVLKDVLLFPAMRCIFRPSCTGRERLIGARAHVVKSPEPVGYVRLNGELWRTVARRAGVTIQKGHSVVVRDVEGLTLIVDEEPVTALRPPPTRPGQPDRVGDATLLRAVVRPTSLRKRKQPRG